MICSTFHGTYSHYEFVAMIDQYEGDIRLIKEKLEIKDAALFNLINGKHLIYQKINRIFLISKNLFLLRAKKESPDLLKTSSEDMISVKFRGHSEK